MDILLNVLLLILFCCINYLSLMQTRKFQKIRKICISLIFLFIIYFFILINNTFERFQTGGAPRKIKKLKEMCGIPLNDSSTNHCFADGTHQTCCLLGPEARKYAEETRNRIGDLSVKSTEKFYQQNPNKTKTNNLTSWCTCLGSRVCSYYAKKFNDGTRVKLINDRNSNDVAIEPPSYCEAHYGNKFKTLKHRTPGIKKILKASAECKKFDKNVIQELKY